MGVFDGSVGMKSAPAKHCNVLILGNPEYGDELADWLDSHATVRHVDNFESALRAIKNETYDYVLCRTAEFIPVTDLHFAEQTACIFDNVSHGVCVVDESGRLLWVNPKFESLEDGVREHVLRCCTETIAWARQNAHAGAAQVPGRHVSLTTKAGQHFELMMTPIVDVAGQTTQVAAIVWDTTPAKRLQERIDALDRAGNELVRLDAEQVSRMNMEERLGLLEQKIVRCIHELLHFDNFGIYVLDRRTNKLELVLSYGIPESAGGLELYAVARGSGISGHVATTGRSYICPDVTADPLYLQGIAKAKSSLTIPLRLNDQVVGVANFESTQRAAFGEEDRQFAEIFGRYAAMALHILKLLVTERSTTFGQVGSDVLAEITGPLNDILTEIEALTEDYIGHDDLRHRLRVLSDNAVKIRESTKQVAAQKPNVLGIRQAGPAKVDPDFKEKRVLIADDEDVIRETLRDVLSGYGCEVTCALDGAQAIEKIQERAFDLVLSDIKMPHKNGYEVFAAAKHSNPDTPVVLMTGFGYDPNHSIVRARKEGLSAVLFKPFKIEQLVTELRSALQSARDGKA